VEQPRLVFTVKEFCGQAKISTRHFYSLQERGEGPKVIRLGRRVLINQETAKSWLLGLEGKAVTPPSQEPVEPQPNAGDSAKGPNFSGSASLNRTPVGRKPGRRPSLSGFPKRGQELRPW
jgi:hypothetical protein